MYRTHFCDDIREKDIGQKVQLAGWVDTIRDHGGVIFVDLRDYTGVTQVVIHDESMLANVNRETVITVSGTVIKRDPETVNKKINTGEVEILAETLDVLGECRNMLPFDIQDSKSTKEDVRLKYRYLDLRNPEVKKKTDGILAPVMRKLYSEFITALEKSDRLSPIFTAHIDYVNQSRYKREIPYEENDKDDIVADFIASMTDDYFISLFNALFTGHGYEINYKDYF